MPGDEAQVYWCKGGCEPAAGQQVAAWGVGAAAIANLPAAPYLSIKCK